MRIIVSGLLLVTALLIAFPSFFTSAEMLTPTPAFGVSPTPDPYADLTIPYLASRAYGGGELQVHQVLDTYPTFTRYLISYPSDGLTIYGFMNVPNTDGPFPVIIALHGYIDPGIYTTIDYTTHYADELAQAGYLVIHPNLRGYWPSDDGPNLFRVGFAIDVLNLIALVRQYAGYPGPLELAQPEAIGLWGHSMGGGVSLRVLTLSPDVKAAVLYGSMSGDEQKNYEQIAIWSGGTRGQEELSIPAEALQRIGAIYYLDRIQASISLHHGENDEQVPLEWTADLCSRLIALQKSVECFSYEDEPHTFTGDGDQLFIHRTIAFFDAQLKR